MELEQFYVYDVVSPLTPERKAFIEKHIDDNAATFGKEVTKGWHKSKGEDFLRIHVDQVVIEIVFSNKQVEIYGAAPGWARLLFTNQRKEELGKRIEDVLLGAGLITPESVEAHKRPKRKLCDRAKERSRGRL